MPRFILLIGFIYCFYLASGQDMKTTHLTGVFKGQTLFIKNPYNTANKNFCVQEVYCNGKKLVFNDKVSAIVLDFSGVDLYSPVFIRLIHQNGCEPIVINPDAIAYNSTFAFEAISFTDSLLTWETVGERPAGSFEIEYFDGMGWNVKSVLEAKGNYEKSEYQYFPELSEGANKIRIKYIFPEGSYLYSDEIDSHFYPDKVNFSPVRTKDFLELSRAVSFEVYDYGGTLVMSGSGRQVDVRSLPYGKYVIYFDGKDPATFEKY